MTCRSYTKPVMPCVSAEPVAVVCAALAPARATMVAVAGEATPSSTALSATTLKAYVSSSVSSQAS
jgi:hypothetical protein